MTATTDLAAFIDYWQRNQGGAERANYTVFVNQLCDVLDLPKPGAGEGGTLGDYQFEGPVPGGSLGGGTGFIDLYRRNHFILEAKQSKLPPATQPSLYDPAETAPAAPSGAKYDQLMRDARRQAEQYAHTLPGSHAPVPFLIVCDVGRAFELYFDYAGNGRGYGFFPDKQRYRIALAELASEEKVAGLDQTPADVLRAVWLDPASIDPRVRSADVTRDVAKKLAQVSLHLEQEGRIELKRRGHADAAHEAEMVEGTALFLMRILFCMFAEDVGLLPQDKFKAFLQSCALPYDPDHPERLIDTDKLRRGLNDLWEKMGAPNLGDRWTWTMEEPVRYFNGGLFETRAVFPLARNDLDSLIDAAKHRWTNVEPAIFGTLLEQALSPADRAKLGAHYTPRPYVERLVQATITDVLAPEWAAAEDVIRVCREGGDDAGALAKATEFLAYLQRQRVLDPACGTGNFLYVAMETLLRLESDVIETIAALGGGATPAIGPANFLGLELNPRAAVIAELVLWIGWLRWRTANDPAAVPDPVLRRTAAINFGSTHGYDAVLARDEAGEVEMPPRQPEWPEAEFIVGNPPFIGKGAEMRRALGTAYVEALRRANRNVAGGADFVMQWWDRGAEALTMPESALRRFGLVTTNSITQEFSRRVIQRHLAPPNEGAEQPLSLVYAIADHPWTRASRDSAAVRIAMTVAQAGAYVGVADTVIGEAGLDGEQPNVLLSSSSGHINSDLTSGTDITGAIKLRANDGLSNTGILLAAQGFAIDTQTALSLIEEDGPDSKTIIKPYIGGSELMGRPEGRSAIDFQGLTEKEARVLFPSSYTHVLTTVKPERDSNPQRSRRENWWLFGRSNAELRAALSGLKRFIATTRTAKHRAFQFVSGGILPNHEVVAIASCDAYILGAMSSEAHVIWATVSGGWMGVGNDSRYNKSKTFDPFPFPDPTPEQRAVIADLGEELDATRKAALAEHPRLTMTGLYNLVEKLRAGAALTPVEETDARDARARIVLHLHDQLDAAVAAAYGWPADLAPAEIVARLVALNAERAAEEATGHIRWLRPDYQIPRFAK